MDKSSQIDFLPRLFLLMTGMLIAIGLVMVYSSSMTAYPSEKEKLLLVKQFSYLMLAAMAGLIASQLPKSFWKETAQTLFVITLFLLVLVLIPGMGTSVNGAQRWLRFGGFSLQPSETAKLTLPLLLASFRLRTGSAQNPTFRETLLHFGLIAVVVMLILVEPDFGTAVFVGMTGSILLLLSGWPLRHFVMAGIISVPVAALLLASRPYQMSRLHGFLDTWLHPDQAPYQVQQSLMTLGAGEWTGTGLGKGWQKLSFLPEANTDFVFAVIGEEWGLIGTLGVLVLWGALLLTGRKLIQRCEPGSFERIVSMTLLMQLVIQAMINVAVVTALLPPKGISHPFISYGGSNLVVSMVSLGIIMSLTRSSSGDQFPVSLRRSPDVKQAGEKKYPVNMPV